MLSMNRRQMIKTVGGVAAGAVLAPLVDWVVVEPVEGDDTETIQDAIDAADAGMTIILQGEFTVTDCLILKSSICIDGLGAAVIEGTITNTGTNYGIFYTTADLSNVKIRGMRLVRKSGGMGGVIAFNGDPSYQYTGCGLYDLDCYSENANCFPYSCGEGLEVLNCTFRGSNLVSSIATEIGYNGQPSFKNCRFISGQGSGITAYGLYVTDNGGGLFTGCHMEGQNYGTMITASGNPRFMACEFVSTGGVPLTVQGAAAPLFDGCLIHPKFHSALYLYDTADDDEIAPIISGEAYRIYSMHIRRDAAQAGKMLDIGSTESGDDVVADLDLDSTAYYPVDAPWDVLFDADEPMHLTPSGTIATGCLRVIYSVMVDTDNVAIYATTTGKARFVNCYILGSPSGIYLTDDGAEFIKCVIECPDESKYVINYSTPSTARFYDCLYRGAVRNVGSWDTF